ncbi:Linear gramicidin dehydrogenase LgrE [compost metagenome]
MKFKLFCLPYAGGSATVYHRWKRYLHEDIEIHPLELAARGRRMAESHYLSMHEMLEDLYSQLETSTEDDIPFLLFGHSMGALIAYELAHMTKQRLKREPAHLFVSGTYPPHAKKNNVLHLLSDERLQQEIKQFGGTEEELFEREELIQLFLPVLRRDLELIETHAFTSKPDLIHCDISVLNGIDDPATEDYVLSEWARYSSKSCQVYSFQGGHFFINEQTEQVVSLIHQVLCNPVLCSPERSRGL